ncbi:MAG: hypothetical protein ACYTX0_51015, partial [Nostoc sp.]
SESVVACHNKLTNKNRTIAQFRRQSDRPFTHLRGISNDYTTFSPYANKRSVNHMRSPNHRNHRQSVGLFKRVQARRCSNYLDKLG